MKYSKLAITNFIFCTKYKKIVEIAEMLPDLSLQVIERTLRYVSGSKEQAMDLLLNGVEITEEMVETNSSSKPSDEKVTNMTNEIHYLEKTLLNERARIDEYRKTITDLGGKLSNENDQYDNDVILRKIQFEHSTLQRKMFQEKASKNTKFYCKGEEKALANNTVMQYTLNKTVSVTQELLVLFFSYNVFLIRTNLTMKQSRFISAFVNHSSTAMVAATILTFTL